MRFIDTYDDILHCFPAGECSPRSRMRDKRRRNLMEAVLTASRRLVAITPCQEG